MEGHDVHRPMTNAKAEVGATDAPAPFREAREPREPHQTHQPREPREPREFPDESPGRAADPVRDAPINGAPSPLGADPPPEAPQDRTLVGHVAPQRQPAAAMHGTGGPADLGDAAGLDRGATAPQLRRFIKSRAYVPIHELRRRFGLNGNDDDVTPVDIDRTRVFVGLPDREGRLLGELLRAGDIGYELSMDPVSPIVVGVYPMRPVTRN
jgi:hypothetical protein